MPWGAAIGLVGAVGGALISSNANKAAANKQKEATDSANSEQQREYDQAREDEAPYRESGVTALNKLNGLMNDPNSITTNDPSYGFGLSQGTQAISRSAAGAGGLYSGATLKALDRYGQDYAGTKLNDQYNRYANIAGLGQVATAGTTAAGTNAANQIGANTTGLGNALAGNALNQGNIYSNALNQVASSFSSYGGKSGWGSSGGYTSGGSAASNGADNIDAGGGWNPSDVRLKTDIVRVGTSPRGYGLYKWVWRSNGMAARGVIAQEVAKVDPSAVRRGDDGYFMVDYSKV